MRAAAALLFLPRIPGVPAEVHLLHQDVAAVQDGDAELEGDGHHGAQSTWCLQAVH